MLVLTPVTIKSTKSMIAMQRLQPEMKKLQAKYRGPENREALNAEMMKLYKENGTSPFGACLPSLLQMPFLIVLYSLIRGLSYIAAKGQQYTNAAGKTITCQVKACVAPRYIPSNSQIHQNLIANKGQMHSFFGMDLSSSPFTHHGSDQALLMIPYLALIAIAIFLQYYQMKQMNSRNPGAAQANPQMQTMQKFFPLIFGVIYLRVPAGATIYMVVSSAMRIGTQEFMFRTGMVTPVAAEREIGGAGKAKATKELAPAPKPAPKKPRTVRGDRRDRRLGAEGHHAPDRARPQQQRGGQRAPAAPGQATSRQRAQRQRTDRSRD